LLSTSDTGLKFGEEPIGVALRRQSQALVEQMILACHRILSQGTHPEQLFKLLFGEAVYIA
jgi:hypothetical protein